MSLPTLRHSAEPSWDAPAELTHGEWLEVGRGLSSTLRRLPFVNWGLAQPWTPDLGVITDGSPRSPRGPGGVARRGRTVRVGRQRDRPHDQGPAAGRARLRVARGDSPHLRRSTRHPAVATAAPDLPRGLWSARSRRPTTRKLSVGRTSSGPCAGAERRTARRGSSAPRRSLSSGPPSVGLCHGSN
jgi:hypothetical protein